MTKYQEALENVKEVAKWQRNIYIRYGYICGKDIEALEELVDKATPKKPMYIKSIDEYRCKNCGHIVIRDWQKMKYCLYCGQALDWSEEE